MTSDLIGAVQRAIIVLIGDVVSGSLCVVEFCNRFGALYNRDSEPSLFEPWFRAICEPLFEVVVWYSPYPDERTQIPNYLDEGAVLNAARVAHDKLQYRGPAS